MVRSGRARRKVVRRNRRARRIPTPRRGLPAVGAVLVVAAVALGGGAAIVLAGGGLPDGAVATVDGKAIDKASFEHWLRIAASSGGQQSAQVPKPPHYAACVSQKRKAQPKPAKGKPKTTAAELKRQCEQEYQDLRERALHLLISQVWIEGEARELGISLRPSEVKKSFDDQRKQRFPKDADYRKFLATSGQTERDTLLRVRLDMLSTRIREKATKGNEKVTDKQVADYYELNKLRFGQPERRDLRIVLARTKARARRAKAALRKGDSWRSVAKTYSIDKTSRSKAGKLPGVPEHQLERGLDESVFNAPKGRLRGPVNTQFGYYIFKVTKVTRGSQQPLREAKAMIKQLITSERRQKKAAEFLEKLRQKWVERTECRKGYVMQDCGNAPKPPSQQQQP